MHNARSSSWLLGRESNSVLAGIHPLPGVGLQTTPGVDLETSPSGEGLETPLGQTPQLPPWVCTWRPARHSGIPPPRYLQGMLGYHLQCMLGYHPPRGQNSWHTLLKILPCPKLRLRAVNITGLTIINNKINSHSLFSWDVEYQPT